jgi:anaerobic ribonucleoside-triphosphate reductase activating protein
MIRNSKLRVYHVIFSSRANGPGKRAVIWLKGCSLRCPGCFNPGLQNPEGGLDMETSTMAAQVIAHRKDVEGITVSGGEPVEQIEPLIHLLSIIKEKTNLSVLLFSGKTLAQIQVLKNGPELLSLTDVLVDGIYDKKLANPQGIWPTSTNQSIILLTSRYLESDFKDIPSQEIFIGPTGEIIVTGLYGSETSHIL